MAAVRRTCAQFEKRDASGNVRGLKSATVSAQLVRGLKSATVSAQLVRGLKSATLPETCAV
jgi:hypothetical protein